MLRWRKFHIGNWLGQLHPNLWEYFLESVLPWSFDGDGALFQDLVHPREVNGHTALQRHDMAFQTSAAPKRVNRHLVARADLDDLTHLIGRLREGNSIRRTQG
jgi:hypothetical protein